MKLILGMCQDYADEPHPLLSFSSKLLSSLLITNSDNNKKTKPMSFSSNGTSFYKNGWRVKAVGSKLNGCVCNLPIKIIIIIICRRQR